MDEPPAVDGDDDDDAAATLRRMKGTGKKPGRSKSIQLCPLQLGIALFDVQQTRMHNHGAVGSQCCVHKLYFQQPCFPISRYTNTIRV